MSLKLTLWKYSKRENSTAIPSTPGTELDILLKDRTQILSPVFLLELSSYPDYNYALFEGRYYFITQIESLREDLWSLSCRVDVLGSYKTEILASSAFVAYDTTTNTEISDKRLSTKTTTVREDNVADVMEYIGTGVTVIVNVVGEKNCETYAVDPDDAMNLLNTLDTWKADVQDSNIDYSYGTPSSVEEGLQYVMDMMRSVGENVTDRLIQGMRQMLGSGTVSECIRSAYILPIAYSKMPGTAVPIQLGRFTSTISGKPLHDHRYLQDGGSVVIPWQSADWRRNAPYTEIYLYIPFVGVMSFPPSGLIDVTELKYLVSIDTSAGDCMVTVALDPPTGSIASKVIGQYSSNIAANFAIGSANTTPRQIGTAIVGAAGAVAGGLIGGPAGAAVGLAGLKGEINALQTLPSSIGGAGGGAVLGLFGYKPRCMVIFHDTVVAPDSVSAIMGTPANAVKSLASLTGYVQTVGASIAGPMLDAERSQINKMLDGGIYIE